MSFSYRKQPFARVIPRSLFFAVLDHVAPCCPRRLPNDESFFKLILHPLLSAVRFGLPPDLTLFVICRSVPLMLHPLCFIRATCPAHLNFDCVTRSTTSFFSLGDDCVLDPISYSGIQERHFRLVDNCPLVGVHTTGPISHTRCTITTTDTHTAWQVGRQADRQAGWQAG